MYIVGHTALAYLVLRPFISSRKAGDLTRAIILIFICANIIDILNYKTLRYYGHNLLGTFLFTGVWIAIFYKLKLIEKRTVPLLFAATGTHVIADVLFSEYYLFAPFENTAYSYFGIYGPIDHLAESVLFVSFLIVFISTKDHLKLKEFLDSEKIKLSQPFEYTDSYGQGLIISIIFIAFYLFSVLQLFYFIFESRFLLSIYMKRTWLYLGAFIAFIILFTYLGFYSSHRYHKSKMTHRSRSMNKI